MNTEFIECDTCSAKPGSPYLCGGCLHNRDAMFHLNEIARVRRLDPREFLGLKYEVKVDVTGEPRETKCDCFWCD